MADPISAASSVVGTMRGVTDAWNWTHAWLNVEPSILYTGSADVTVSETADIRAFLEQQNTQMLIRLYGMTLLYESLQADDGSLVVFWLAFEAQAKDWLSKSGGKWNLKIASVWSEITDILPRLLPKDASEALGGYDIFCRFFMFTRESMPTSKLISTFHQRVFETVGDLNLLAAADRLANEIAESSRSAPNALFSHLSLDSPVDRAQLYIDRDLNLPNEDQPLLATDAINARPFRMVLLGNPGAGKSTLVEHIRRDPGNTDKEWSECTVLLRCREYVSEWWQESIVEAIRRTVERDLAVSINDLSTLEASLLVGRVTVVFDGLDEVLDAGKRVEFRDRILRFLARYPLSSTLITSRPLGYAVASFPQHAYAHATLSEFTLPQIQEYARRWFTCVHEPELAEAFLREVLDVSDVASNPLLLSMLCSLYKVDGYIPANRYDVYEGCANLLFSRWDQHRHIAHPLAKVNYGTRLMMVIGRQFYISEAAQSGVDERQLKKLLAVYLRDHVGVDEPDVSAAEFLDFCAERAWLLVNLGTHPKYGIRVFGFAHRTFYEYFAARALARSARRDAEIASDIVGSFRRDESSFLPELIIQAVDEARENGGSQVFDRVLKHKNVSPALILRLMNAPMPATLRARGFSTIAAYWMENGCSASDVLAVAGLNGDANSQLARVLGDGQFSAGVLRLLDAWSELVLRGQDYLIRGERMLGLMRELATTHDSAVFSGPVSRVSVLGYDASSYVAATRAVSDTGHEVAPARVCVRGLSVALGIHSAAEILPLDLIGATEGATVYPGILGVLLATDDTHLIDQVGDGLEAMLLTLLCRRLYLPIGLRDLVPRMLNRSIPEVLDPAEWTDGQLRLAVGLEQLFVACGKHLTRNDRLTSALAIHHIHRAGGKLLMDPAYSRIGTNKGFEHWNWIFI